MNQAIITGRLTRDPELRNTSNGSCVVLFSVAVQRPYAPKGKEREVDFIPCKAFGHTGEFIARNFQKGSPIEVNGSIEIRGYEDAEGKKRTATEIVVSSVNFVPASQKREDKEKPQNLPF